MARLQGQLGAVETQQRDHQQLLSHMNEPTPALAAILPATNVEGAKKREKKAIKDREKQSRLLFPSMLAMRLWCFVMGIQVLSLHFPPTSQQPIRASESPVLTINVGGKLFTTRLSTLTRYPGSFLEAMFSGRFKSQSDAEGHVFIDRDPEFFADILK